MVVPDMSLLSPVMSTMALVLGSVVFSLLLVSLLRSMLCRVSLRTVSVEPNVSSRFSSGVLLLSG